MGDRGNIVIETSDGNALLFFYTHYYGSALHILVAKALENGKDRWGDTPYLNRILFCSLVKNDVDGTTGAGIDTVMGDGGCEVYVCHEDERVRFNGKTYTFAEFVENFKDEDEDDEEDEE